MAPSNEEAARRGDRAGATITNYLLFNHTYLRRLQADRSVDKQASLGAQGVRDWYSFRDDSSIRSIVDSWVGPLLNTLELGLQPLDPEDARIHLLYTAWDHATPVGLCYVTPPGADLDASTKGEHWMAEAVLAARRWEPTAPRDEKGEADDRETQALRWVILTNGNQWRLLDAQALRRYEAYLQVDLEELVRDPGDLSALRVFYRCFHRSAFERDAEGESGLDRLLEASSRATKKAETHLKACVSANEGVMARLCLGLVESTGKDRFTEEERDAIYRDATYLLYRMLFILYAEARDLLPIDNPAYQRRSLSRLVETAYEYRAKGIPDPKSTTLWDRLKQLCKAIYESDERLGIPAYNGGLFDDADKPYLREHTITDGHLTQALFDLAYQPDGNADNGYRRIDYRDLSVRHLGSIYEGMIEYRLQIAEETLWARRDKKGNVEFLKIGQDGAPRRNDVEIEKGDVYFSQSPGERRATGTYYTPEYVVDYIVRQTVVRGLQERRASLEEKLVTWLEEVAPAIDSSERQRMQRTADEELLRFVEEEVLTFRVCDPAMGSGHFLVNAAHQIAAFIVETLHLTPWANHQIDADGDAWRRRVVESCLYGVDISMMAVELAKLSLWLASVAEGKPLSFLDHHLRHGNSLIGARLQDLAEVLPRAAQTKPSRRERRAREAGQLSMLDDPALSQHLTVATDTLAQISARVSETVADIKAQEADYERVRSELAPYRRLADLWTARHFGLSVDPKQFSRVAESIITGATRLLPQDRHLLHEAQERGQVRCFFHWDLEFPDAFFSAHQSDSKDWRGFDAVIGNPPYGLIRDPQQKTYVGVWYEAADYQYDVFVAFTERAIGLTRIAGLHSFIVPTTLLVEHYFGKLRAYVMSRTRLREILHFKYPVFDEPTVESAVYCLETVRDQSLDLEHRVRVAFVHSKESLTEKKVDFDEVRQAVFDGLPGKDFNVGLVGQHAEIAFRLMSENTTPLGDIAEITVGVKPYQTGKGKPKQTRTMVSKRVYDSNYQVDERYRRYLMGRDIHRYCIEPCEDRWISYGQWLAEPRPAAPFSEPIKILIRQTGDSIIAAVDTQQYLTLNNIHNLRIKRDEPSYHCLLAILNSKLLTYFHQLMVPEAGRAFAEVKVVDLVNLPIRLESETVAPQTREYSKAELTREFRLFLATGETGCLMNLVVRGLRSEPQQVHMVHDFLTFLAQQMIGLTEERHRLEQSVDLFHFVQRDTSCLPLEKASGGPLRAGKMVREVVDPSVVHHDIEGLRLNQQDDGRWLLAVRAKLRDPEADWREHQRDADGNFIRQWLPVYRLGLDQETGLFYHYAFANLDGFDGAGKFPGGFTRTTLKKLQLTKVPQFVPVDLEPLAALDEELAEVRRKIQLTDDLIDQIVYELYGLTEEEIAIVEGRA